jgi:hypothetical protein
VHGAEDAVGDQRVARARPGHDQVRAQCLRLVPVAELAHHVGHAAQAHLLLRAAALAEAHRGAERLARPRVVARDLVGGAEALEDLGGLDGQAMLERERQPGADHGDALVVGAELDGGHALQAERPRAQVGALGADRLVARGSRRGHRLVVAARALVVAGHDQTLGRRLAGQVVGGVGLGGHAPGGQRVLAVALQGVQRRDPALGIGKRAARALRVAGGDHLALCPCGLAQITGQLGVVRVAVERLQAIPGALARRPQVQRLAAEACGVPVGVHRGAPRDRLHQRLERARGVAGGDPVARDLGRVALFERLGDAAVQRAPLEPGDVVVQRLADQRVPEGGLPRLGLAQHARGEQLADAGLTAEVRH